MTSTSMQTIGILRTLLRLLPVFAALTCSQAMAAKKIAEAGASRPDAIYHNYCSVCHGDRGNGQSRAKNSLSPPPRDFTSGGELTREAMIAFITHGKPGTAMVAWKTQLSTAEIEAVTDYIRKTFMAASIDPRLQRGKAVYAQNCIACHGPNGQGTNLPVGGPVPVRDLASPQARAELTRERMITSVTMGRQGTAMAPFGSRLSAQDIEATVDYVRAVLMVPDTNISGTNAHAGRASAPSPATAPKPEKLAGADMKQPMPNNLKGDAAKGGRFYMANCATCHGAKGDGKGPRAYFINPKPRNFLDAKFRASFNRPAVFAATSMGRLGTEMPAWSKVLSEQEVADVSEFVFQRFIQSGQKARKPG